jgi:hypothetical protein
LEDTGVDGKIIFKTFQEMGWNDLLRIGTGGELF